MAFSSFLSELRYICVAAQKPARANVQYADLRFYIWLICAYALYWYQKHRNLPDGDTYRIYLLKYISYL